MDPKTATAMIRYIVAREAANVSKKDHGTFYRTLMGTTFSSLKKNSAFIAPKPAYLPSTSSRAEAMVFLWTFIKKPTKSNDIFFEQGIGIAKAFMMPVIGNVSGGATASVATGYGTVGDVQKASGVVGGAVSGQGRANAAAGITGGLNRAWRAGLWSSIDQSQNGFSLSMGETMYACGIGVISETGNKSKIALRLAEDLNHFRSWMRFAEDHIPGSSGWGNYLYSIVRPGELPSSNLDWTYDSVTKELNKVGN